MNILEENILNKRKEVALLKEQRSYRDLEKARLFSRGTFSLSDFITDLARSGIIAESRGNPLQEAC